MIELFVGVPALLALGVALWSLRRGREKIAALEADVDAVEKHNRSLVAERDTVKATLAETSAALDAAGKRLEAVEAERRELEQQRAALAETAARLEKARAELEADLARLRREHESLEHRVVDFQGQWSHQLSTLEAEISTLIRQLGEFRKGTTLPIPRPELSSPAESAGGAGGPFGPRLAAGRPRPISSESTSPDPAAARRAP
jgi:predicted RNase H-like nuclease (RuvC/YqgF family)